jgi:chromosomal replication initiation ATPase DnaA
MMIETRAKRRRAPDADEAALLTQMVAVATRVPADEIVSGRRLSPRAVRARRYAMYLANVVYQWPLHRVGAAFGRDRTTVGLACKAVEDLRDDPRIDEGLDRLEACLKAAPAGLLESGAEA